MAPRPLWLRSFLFVVAFPPVVPPWWSPSSFSLPMHHDLIPSILLSFRGVCPALVPSSFLQPSYLAAASQVVLSPWLTLMQFLTLLPVVMISISVGCWLILVNLTVFCLDHTFSVVSSSLLELLYYVGFLSSSFRVLSVLRFCPYTLGSPSPPSSFHHSRCRLVFSHGSSPSGITFLHRFHLPSTAPVLSLSLPHFLRCYSFSVLSAPSVFVSFLLVYMTYCSLASCSLFRCVAGCFVARAPLCLSMILRSYWGSRLPHSRLLPSSWILLRFLSFAPLLFCLAISLLPFNFPLVFPSGHFGVCLP